MLSDKIKEVKTDLEKIRALTVAFLPTTSRHDLVDLTFKIADHICELEAVILSLNLALSLAKNENKDLKVLLASKGIML
jgi:hypothetical protein